MLRRWRGFAILTAMRFRAREGHGGRLDQGIRSPVASDAAAARQSRAGLCALGFLDGHCV